MQNSQNEDSDLTSLYSLIIELAKDAWRVDNHVTFMQKEGQLLQPQLLALLERLKDDFLVAGVEILDPSGEPYDRNANLEVAYIDGASERLKVVSTVDPGVRIKGKLMARAKVSLGPQ